MPYGRCRVVLSGPYAIGHTPYASVGITSMMTLYGSPAYTRRFSTRLHRGTVTIPTDLLDRPFACACGRTPHIPTRQITVGRGALDALPEALAATGGPVRLLAVSDAATRKAAWDAIGPRLRSLGLTVIEVVLPPGPHPPPLADQPNPH